LDRKPRGASAAEAVALYGRRQLSMPFVLGQVNETERVHIILDSIALDVCNEWKTDVQRRAVRVQVARFTKMASREDPSSPAVSLPAFGHSTILRVTRNGIGTFRRLPT
jgi:hypothetical protein